VRIIFDQGTPVPLRKLLTSHQVETAYERGWSKLTNGELLRTAENEGFEVLITTDKNLRNQQNLGQRAIAIVVLSSTSWPRIQKSIESVRSVIAAARPGTFQEVKIS
jgi:hypothetical protein